LAGWKNRTDDDLDVLTTIFWSAGASRHALATRRDYSKSKANGLVAGLLDESLLTESGCRIRHVVGVPKRCRSVVHQALHQKGFRSCPWTLLRARHACRLLHRAPEPDIG
jgi:hypothetical protein